MSEPLSAEEEAKFRESVRLISEDAEGDGWSWWSNTTAARLLATLDAERAASDAAAPRPEGLDVDEMSRFLQTAWTEADHATDGQPVTAFYDDLARRVVSAFLPPEGLGVEQVIDIWVEWKRGSSPRTFPEYLRARLSDTGDTPTGGPLVSEPLSPRDALHRIVDKRTADNDGYWISAREMRYAEEALAASERPPVDPVREALGDAIRLACNTAGPRLGHTGRFDDCPQSLCVRVRAALAPAAPRPEGLDVERLRWMIEQLPVVPGDYTEVVGQDGRGPFISKHAVIERLSDTGDTE